MVYAIPAIGQEPSLEAIQPSYGQVGYAGMPYHQYEQYRQAIGKQKDSFEGKHKPERSLLFWAHKKQDGFFTAAGKSLWNVAVAGPANFIQKQLWSEKEGFFRAVKTIGTLVVGGAVIAAGFAMAPAITAGALAVFSAVGLGFAGLQGLRQGLSWAGNMVTGKYKQAVENAHDLGEAGADGAMAALGLRQMTSMAMRLNGNSSHNAGASSFWNLRRSLTDTWNNVFSTNYWRTGLQVLKTNVSRFKSDVVLNSYNGNNGEIRAIFDGARNRVQEVLVRDPLNTTAPRGSAYPLDPPRFMRRVQLGHKLDAGLAEQIAKGETTIQKVLSRPDGSIEMLVRSEKPGDLTALFAKDRLASVRYDRIVASKSSLENTRLVNSKVTRPDGSSFFQTELKDVGVALRNGEQIELSANPVFRAWEGVKFKVRKAVDGVRDLGSRAYENYWSGESFQTQVARNYKASPTNAKSTTYRIEDVAADARMLTSHSVSPEEWATLSRLQDGEITPALGDKLSGFGRTVLDYLGRGMQAATTQHNVQRASMAANESEHSMVAAAMARELTRQGNATSISNINYVQHIDRINPTAGTVTRIYLARIERAGGIVEHRRMSYTFPEGSNGLISAHIADNPDHLISAINRPTGPRGFWRRTGEWLSDMQPENKPQFTVGNSIPMDAILTRIRSAGGPAARAAAEATEAAALVASGEFANVAHATQFVRQARIGLNRALMNNPANHLNRNNFRIANQSNLWGTGATLFTPGYANASESLDFTPAEEEDDDAAEAKRRQEATQASNAFQQSQAMNTQNPFTRPPAHGTFERDDRIC